MEKTIEIYYIKTLEILESKADIIYTSSEINNDYTTSVSTKANLNDNYSSVGQVLGESTNRFDLKSGIVYVKRQDTIYINDRGELIFDFAFKQQFNDKSILIISNPGTSYVCTPIYKSGIYKNKNVIITLDIFKGYRTLTIEY